jgi:type I restriction enzyme M protein
MTNNDIVQKLWNLCDVLRDDGINYSDYVTELVLLLFIKMEYENTEAGLLDKHKLPEGCRWPDLNGKSGLNLLNEYKRILFILSTGKEHWTRINCQSNLPSQGLGIDLQFSNRSALYRVPVLVFSCLWAFLQAVSDSILGCLDHGVTVLPPMLRPPEHEYQRTPLNLTGIKKPAKPYD